MDFIKNKNVVFGRLSPRNKLQLTQICQKNDVQEIIFYKTRH